MSDLPNLDAEREANIRKRIDSADPSDYTPREIAQALDIVWLLARVDTLARERDEARADYETALMAVDVVVRTAMRHAGAKVTT